MGDGAKGALSLFILPIDFSPQNIRKVSAFIKISLIYIKTKMYKNYGQFVPKSV